MALQVKFDLYEDDHDSDSLAQSYEKLSDESLLWGPYRSGLYFGIRPRIPKSLLSGLMWFSVNDYEGVANIKHSYEQADNMRKANWISYDPRTGGRQVIDDLENHVTLVIDFVKSSDGKSWGVTVKSKPHKGFESSKISFVWYSGLEGERNENGVTERTGHIKLDNPKDSRGYDETVKILGVSEELGLFEVEITDGPSTNKHPEVSRLLDPTTDPTKTHHLSLVVPDDNVWRAKDIFMTLLQESVKDLIERYETLEYFPPEQSYLLRDLQDFEGNLHFVQKTYEGRAEFDIFFKSSLTPATEQITSENIRSKVKSAKKEFNEKFKSSFPLSAPFNNSKKHDLFAKEIISGLLGGLSYFYGDQLVDRETVFDEDSFESYELHGTLEGPRELFTLVPSRPFFPRGFLWDEGFHLLPLLDYDSDLALDIMKSWFKLIDDNGWIAREQILGPELRSRVPEQFITQSPEIVNPPTLMLAFTFLLESVQNNEMDILDPSKVEDSGSFEDARVLGLTLVSNQELLKSYTKELYPKLKAYYENFRKSQQGYIAEFNRGDNREGYRWRGRTLTHSLASGLDDYPRVLPADVAELNVDLLSWIGVMTRSMKYIAEVSGFTEDFHHYQNIELDIIQNIEHLHWSEEEKTYCDVSVDDDDENIYFCSKGYVSLFPFLTKMIPSNDTEKLTHIVDLISDPEQLWTDFGIRSLSKSDEYYKTGEDYWRSPIWININYLILDSMYHYKSRLLRSSDQELKDKLSTAYEQLRLNLVNNIVDKWEETGYVWEQYNDETGSSQGAKNFLGWSSTVILMMKMPATI
ncbi:glycoside hydrolase family 63 protein [Suhomyces tanzawaensis NRRL Y-17324]|uniref:Mannosyl-oligosaccharide glucosidase n=1 Tax=Suhomyces tanzawaensis NRRL Y-17324 TaxID=984487 RepID=A0A1E4SE73_9ASCO|nr:glycoside hydrolase family 63 protein [Suhomyces tanzawaensis NRRL Y-17324]ODV77805.1 glycoside hydrolase family 63 protein [Suhomyces tanzawaensis NRRL Y-17324]